MPDINGIPYVESTDLVSGWPTVSQSVAQEVSDQLASKADASNVALISLGRYQGGTVSSLNINNVFSSSYTRYRLVIGVSSSDGLGYGMRLRASGSDDTNASYDQQVISANGATITSSDAADATAWNIICSQNRELHTFELLNPEAAATTQGHAFNGNSATGAPQIRLRYLQHDDATAFDGLSFYAYTGGETISIVADIFAYNE